MSFWRLSWALILKLGIRRRVGDGKDINVEDKLWIPGGYGSKVRFKNLPTDVKLVSDLISSDGNAWRVLKVFEMFDYPTAIAICDIPLPLT